MHFKKYIVMSQRNFIWDCKLHNSQSIVVGLENSKKYKVI